MKLFILVLLATLSFGRIFNEIIYDPSAPTYPLDMWALDGSQVPFTSHSEDKPFGSYLQMTLDFQPFHELFQQVNQTTGTLKSRGEAHITVITPPEFDRILKPAGITIQEIEAIAHRHRIQQAWLRPVCLGRFKGTLPTKPDQGGFLLYSVVVKDTFNQLLRIRQEIYKLYRKRQGQGALFEAEAFWPHVTLGFDRRDLFIEDGIYKGTNYCFAPIKMNV